MDRAEMLELWNDMWKEGNWISSWPDSLEGLNAKGATWTPDPPCHTIWQEVAHVIFWRQVTIKRFAGGAPPDSEEIERLEFAQPEVTDDAAWQEAVATLKHTQDALAEAIQDASKDVTRIPYHLIHDAYHLGRVTQLRILQGTAPKF